jgi:predicted SnoaL-like aldol condensation-catalyzing enzyme
LRDAIKAASLGRRSFSKAPKTAAQKLLRGTAFRPINHNWSHFMMNRFIQLTLGLALLASTLTAFSQVPVTANPNQDLMLHSSDPKIAANKRLVYDFWREVFEAGHMELAPKYMTESYIQHNPSVPTGRAAFIEFFQKIRKPAAIEPKIKAPLVAIVAEGDLVVLSFVSEQTDPKDPTKKYTTTWFDMFRIENGKIAEHWDPALKR